MIYSTSELDAEKESIQVQQAGLDDMYCPITQAWCNCTITAQIRAADDQSDSRILI